MDHIGASKVRDERWNIDELIDERANVLDAPSESEAPGEHGIDWDEPRLNFSIAVPLAKQPVGLNRLTSENFQRRRDERHVELSHANGGVANDTPAGG